MNFYAYVGNSPVNSRDPSGEEILGITGGVTIPFLPLGIAAGEFTMSGTFVVDLRNPSIDFILTPEAGVGVGTSGILPGSAFLRGVASFDRDVSIESLKRFSPSVTADALLLSGSATRTGDGVVFEAGITTPSISVSGSGGFGFSARDMIRGAIDFFTSDSDLNPEVSSLPGPGAGGGFVLYPSKPNLNGVRNVYAK